MKWQFRVWDIENQKMFKTTKIEITQFETTAKVFESGKHRTLINDKRTNRTQFLLMANVGIRDKNMEEVFDEDIVATDKGIAVIYFQPSRGSFVARLLEKHGGLELLIDEIKESMKILGNVFEDKHLITE